jgi:murein DD-endopeptidase MepM/ murein hydrolase activator NlpD
MVYVRPMSPEEEAIGLSTDPGNPQAEPITWSPLAWIANQASAAADSLRKAGESIYDQLISEAKDLGSTLYAAATGQPPAEPGPLFNVASGIAETIFGQMPAQLQKKLTKDNGSNVAGYITLSDGRKIPVPKAEDTQGQGERALSDSLKAALRKADAQTAAAQIKAQVEHAKLQASQEQFAKTFALKERAAAQAERLGNLQERALELALERETASPAQRALWGRPSTLSPEQAQTTRRVQAIGPGVPGGVVTSPFRWTTE